MISCWEGHSEDPSGALVPLLARVRGISADELLGIALLKKTREPDTRLQRRFQQIEKLPGQEKRQLVQAIDALLKAAQVPSGR